MSDVEEALRKSIEGKCGLGGVMKFNAIYARSFENDDGTPDLQGIIEAIDRTFPADQASAIVATFRKKMEADDMRGMVKTAVARVAARAESLSGTGGETPAVDASYFNADNDVRDIINEARRLRMAMGKSVPSGWAPHADKAALPATGDVTIQADGAIAADAPIDDPAAMMELEKKASDIAKVVKKAIRNAQEPAVQPVLPRANPGTEQPSSVEGEIHRFAYERIAYPSIDIIDFIRYLKDKGYSFQEDIILEKIYVTIEERKKEARSAIKEEVEGLIDATQAPAEPDIRGLFQRLKGAGLVFDEDDVRRTVRDALMRRSSKG